MNKETKSILPDKSIFAVSSNISLVQKESYDATIQSYEQLMARRIEQSTKVTKSHRCEGRRYNALLLPPADYHLHASPSSVASSRVVILRRDAFLAAPSGGHVTSPGRSSVV